MKHTPVERLIQTHVPEETSEHSSDATRNDGHPEVMECIDTEDCETEKPIPKCFTVRLPDDMDGLAKIFQPWSHAPLRLDLPQHLDLNTITGQYLCICEEGWHPDIEEIHLYTDGSSSKDGETSGFAFCVLGWRTVSETKKSSFLGWHGGQNVLDPEDDSFVGAKDHSASAAEASGLTWAHIWLLQSGISLPATFHFDSKTVGLGASGEWNYGNDNVQMGKLRNVAHLMMEARKGMFTRYEHVKAHSLHPCNDLVDALAKMKQQGADNDPIAKPSWKPLFQVQCETLTWGWWWFRGLRGEADAPNLQLGDHQKAVWTKADYETSQNRIPDIERRTIKVSGGFSIGLRVATYNVMTLRDRQTEQGERGEDWKAALLRQQCRDLEVHAIGLQETRATTDGFLHTEEYLRFISGHQQGHHGCELWLAHKPKIEMENGKTIGFTQENCTLLHSDGRLLIVHCDLEGMALNFFVAHAPHEGTEAADKDVWWQTFTQLLQKYHLTGITIILGDFNARLQGEDGVHVGDRICKETNNNGERLHEILSKFSMCAPSTFSEVHSGTDATWTHPRGGKARLDYILTPRTAECLPLWSWVEKDFQTSLTVRDHEAVVLDVKIIKQTKTVKQKKPNYDWDAMATEEGQKMLKDIVSNLQEPTWDCDVHQHWQSLQDQLHEGLGSHFPAKRGKRRIDIFSQKTQQLLGKRKKVKHALDECDDFLDHMEVEMSYKALRFRTTLQAVQGIFVLSEFATVMAHLMCKNFFRVTSTELRKSIKQDKADFVSEVIQRANQGRMNDLYRELRPLRIGGVQRRRGFPTLPGFQWEGEMANTAEESEAFWLRHCSTLEAGVQTNTLRLLQRSRKNAFNRSNREESMDLCQIPSLASLEGAFRHVKMRKSGGADHFRSDLCHLAASELAKKFHPVLLKMCVQKEEPLQMKGGILIPAFKSGDPSKPSDHRSLLLSSHIGKAIRRTVRQRLTPFYESTAPQTHFSIRKGGCVSHASHTLRLFAEAAARKNQSVGILYVDVKSTYYRVVRQLTVRGGDNHDTIRRTLEFFELGDTSLQDLINELAETPECIQSGVDSHYEEILQELLSSTWFTSRRQDVLYESLAGSRPGDGLADVVFAYAFKRILKSYRLRRRRSKRHLIYQESPEETMTFPESLKQYGLMI